MIEAIVFFIGGLCCGVAGMTPLVLRWKEAYEDEARRRDAERRYQPTNWGGYQWHAPHRLD